MPSGIVVALAAWLSAGALMLLSARLLGPHPDPLWQVLGAMGAAAAACVLTLWGARLPAAANGFALPRAAAWILAVAVGIAGLLSSLLAATLVFALFGRPEGVQPVERVVGELFARYGFWGTVLLAAVLPGIVEEALFRGVVLSALRRHWPDGLAIAVSSLAFALLHLDPWRFLPQAVLALLLGWLTVRSASCLPAMLAHAVHNALVLGLVHAGL
ncbi:MAG: type II CAAX endopeptidase family protein [Planctomycetota bacterium]|nr:CPBP family intramembrane metalloprotease [Planctomycetota bacterium]MCX8039307.1 CPBP family intramembrane metalloprotease [Planctomycetota bacterium]MDW8372072.1 type II CAAX endopeptidase family protein [Planctomycetota bacterium]